MMIYKILIPNHKGRTTCFCISCSNQVPCKRQVLVLSQLINALVDKNTYGQSPLHASTSPALQATCHFQEQKLSATCAGKSPSMASVS